MIDLLDDYYRTEYENSEGYDRERAQKKAFSVILPLIMDNELTKQQSVCLRYKYISGKSQQEIADLLHLSQPTVSRHIKAAKEIVNNKLRYCYAALSVALEEYSKYA